MRERVFLESVPPNDTKTAVSSIERLFSRLGDDVLPQKGMRVLLKPNLLAKHAPQKAVTTHPDVVRGVVMALQKRGITDIVLADSPAGAHTALALQGIYRVSGVEAVCKELGVELCKEADIALLRCENASLVHRFTVLKAVAEADYVLNLPKLKTHVLTGMSGACKNLFGCVPGLAKAEFHSRFPEKEDFGHMLCDLCEAVQADLHLMDGILGMEGDGPAGGSMRETGLLLAAQNPHLLDLAVCHFMGLSPAAVPSLAAAMQRGLCPGTFDVAFLHTEEEVPPAPFVNFRLPESYQGSMDFSRRIPRPLQGAAARLTRRAVPHPVVQKKACVLCGKCAEICPAKAVDMQKTAAYIRKKECIRCFCCHEVCPVKAVWIKRGVL